MGLLIGIAVFALVAGAGYAVRERKNRIDHLLRLVHREVARVDVRRKERNVALGKIETGCGDCWRYGKRKNGATFQPAAALCTELLPISISRSAFSGSLA